MHVRPLKHHLKLKDSWGKMRNERMGKPNVTYDSDFFQKSSADFSRRIKTNDYESGRKSTAILSDLVDGRSRVFEIGTGPRNRRCDLRTIARVDDSWKGTGCGDYLPHSETASYSNFRRMRQMAAKGFSVVSCCLPHAVQNIQTGPTIRD